jgi:hypothetical protein
LAYHGSLPYLACLDLTGLEFDETPQTQVELAILQQPPKSLFFCLPEGRKVGREVKQGTVEVYIQYMIYYNNITSPSAALTNSP